MDMDDLQKREKELWVRSEQQMSPDDSWEVYKNLESNFISLLNKNSEYQYHYIRFCLRYMEINKNRAYIIFRSIYVQWKDSCKNDDFPSELLTELLELIKNNSFQYIDFNELAHCADNLFKEQKYELALLYYEALENEHTNENSWDNWAEYYSSIGDLETAIAILKRGLRKIPDSAFIACNLAFYLTRVSNYDSALEYLTTVINQTEHYKFTDNNNYSYAIRLKAGIYVDLDKPLHSFMENSLLLATHGCSRNDIVVTTNELLEWQKSL